MVRTYYFNPSISSSASAILPSSLEHQKRTRLLEQLHQQYTRIAHNPDTIERELAAQHLHLEKQSQNQNQRNRVLTASSNPTTIMTCPASLQLAHTQKPPIPPSAPSSSQPHLCCIHNHHNHSNHLQQPPLKTARSALGANQQNPNPNQQLYEHQGNAGVRRTQSTMTGTPYPTQDEASTAQATAHSSATFTRLPNNVNRMNNINNQALQHNFNGHRPQLNRQHSDSKLIMAQRYRTEEEYWPFSVDNDNKAPKGGVRGSQAWLGKAPAEHNINALMNGTQPNAQSTYNSLPSASTANLRFSQAAPLQMPPNASKGEQRRILVQHEAAQRQAQMLHQQNNGVADDYNPFGKGGGGAPIRDSQGRLVTDRRRMRASWNKTMDTNNPHEFDYNSSSVMASHSSHDLRQRSNGAQSSSTYGNFPYTNHNPTNYYNNYPVKGPTLPSGAVLETHSSSLNLFNNSPTTYGGGSSNSYHNFNSYGNYQPTNALAYSEYNDPNIIKPAFSNAKDAYKEGLRAQIEDKKRREAQEKEVERQREARERLRDDQIAERQRKEIADEKQKEKDKIAEAERKREAAAEKARQSRAEQDRLAAEKRPIRGSRGGGGGNDGLEWWERRPNEDRPASRQLPTNNRLPAPGSRRGTCRAGANPPPRGTIDTFDTMNAPQAEEREKPRSRRRSSVDTTRSNYRPSSSSRRNESNLRNLSATRERLMKEQARVKHAIKSDEYTHDVFSDDDEPLKRSSDRRRSRRRSEDDSAPSFMRKSEKLLREDDDLIFENESLSNRNDPFKKRSSSSRDKPSSRSRSDPISAFFSDDED